MLWFAYFNFFMFSYHFFFIGCLFDKLALKDGFALLLFYFEVVPLSLLIDVNPVIFRGSKWRKRDEEKERHETFY